jgi:Toprim domain-containing protein
MARLSAADQRRLNTWVVEIAATLKPEDGVRATAESVALGSLNIRADGVWCRHSAGRGGAGALALIAHLLGITQEEAVVRAREWLAAHPGEGEFISKDPGSADTAGERLKALYERVLVEACELHGTCAESYLRSRGICSPAELPHLRFWENARLGESALVGFLTDDAGQELALGLVYLDATSGKSLIEPVKVVINNRAYPDHSQAAWRFTCPDTDGDAVDLIVVEGLENALTLVASCAGKKVIGLPGVGRMKKLRLPTTAVVVFKDGKDDVSLDPEGEKEGARRSLQAAIDTWIAAGVQVRVTNTPAGEDANSIGLRDIRRLVLEAPVATSTLEDLVDQAATAPDSIICTHPFVSI